MINNYLLVAFRNLLKNKVFTIINVVGLGIALSVCIVAYFNHMFEYDFDRSHSNFDRIYRLTCFRDMQGREQEYGVVPATLGLEIQNDIPGIEKAARLMRTRSPVKLNDNLFQSQISFVDPEFLQIFTFSATTGDMESILSQANVLISQSMAERLFGDENPLGKSISIINDSGTDFSYTVTAVFRDLPENSSFRIDVLSHYDNFLLMWDVKDTDWKLLTTVLFLMVPEKSLLTGILNSLKEYIAVQNRAREDFRINRFNLIPLEQVGNASRTIWSAGLFPSLHPAAFLAPPVMAIFILFIACFNFANTSRSVFSKRLKEIGLRKTFGGTRRQLVTQFMFETFFVCFLALFAGLALAEFLVPAYSSLWAYMSIKLTFSHFATFWIFLVILVFVTGFVSGVYPAYYVSSFNPVAVIKGDSTVKGSGRISIMLLTFQFSISIMALILGVVFAKNAAYQKTLDRGYDNDKLIVIPVAVGDFVNLRNEILTNPRVISAEGTQYHINWGIYRRPIKDKDKRLEVDVLDIGPGYCTAIGLRLTEGRLFDEGRAGADRTNNSIVVNRKFVEDLDWEEPVGKSVTLYDTLKLTVIGVVEDFYTNGLWQKIEPAMLRLTRNDQYNVLVVRGEPEDLPSVLEFSREKWKEIAPNSLFEGRFVEDDLEEEKDINSSILKVNIFLAVVATLLSLIGMYNLVSLDIIKRTKEIGIRKIQGAPLHNLMFLISRKYIVVFLVAALAGCAGGYYLALKLLDSIWDYFIDINALQLLVSVSIMLMATAITITFKILKASLKNPVESLRYE